MLAKTRKSVVYELRPTTIQQIQLFLIPSLNLCSLANHSRIQRERKEIYDLDLDKNWTDYKEKEPQGYACLFSRITTQYKKVVQDYPYLSGLYHRHISLFCNIKELI